MSLYTHVPGRSELLELMIDTVYGDIVIPDPRRLGGLGSSFSFGSVGSCSTGIRGYWTTT